MHIRVPTTGNARDAPVTCVSNKYLYMYQLGFHSWQGFLSFDVIRHSQWSHGHSACFEHAKCLVHSAHGIVFFFRTGTTALVYTVRDKHVPLVMCYQFEINFWNFDENFDI